MIQELKERRVVWMVNGEVRARALCPVKVLENGRMVTTANVRTSNPAQRLFSGIVFDKTGKQRGTKEGCGWHILEDGETGA
jgi:hypothetical protein